MSNLVRALTLGAACIALAGLGCSSSHPPSGDGDSGDGAGEGGNSGRGGAGGGGAGGSGGGAGSVELGTGDFDSIWKARSGDLMLLDDANAGLPETHSFEFPATHAVDDSGRSVEMYIQIEPDALVIFAWTEGDAAHYRVRQPGVLQDSTFVPDPREGSNAVATYTLDEGVLTLIAIDSLGEDTLYSTVTYGAYSGTFPPSHWPSEVVDAEMEVVP